MNEGLNIKTEKMIELIKTKEKFFYWLRQSLYQFYEIKEKYEKNLPIEQLSFLQEFEFLPLDEYLSKIDVKISQEIIESCSTYMEVYNSIINKLKKFENKKELKNIIVEIGRLDEISKENLKILSKK